MIVIILICDDELHCVEELKKYVSEYMQKRSIQYSIESFTSSSEAAGGEQIYDLAFLDIKMDKIDGISLAKLLKERNSKIIIFFVTSFDEYQDNAMDLRAFRYFEKPFEPERLFSGLDKAMEYLDVTYIDVFFHSGNICKKIIADSIIYLSREKRQTILSTTDGEYLVKGSFDEWCSKLPDLYFSTVHKSFMINLHHVYIYKYSEVIMDNRARVPIAPRKQAEFHKTWFSYIKRR